MSALRCDAADVGISQARYAKVLGRQPSTIHVVHSDAFGDFEDVVCEACNGEGHLGHAPYGRACPVCKCVGPLADALKILRMECREAITLMREDTSYDGGSYTEAEKACDRLLRARGDMHLIARALKAGAR